MKSQLPQLRDIIIIDRGGVTIYDSGIFPARDINLSDRSYFSFHRNSPGNHLYIGKPLKGRNSGKWFLAVSRSIGNSMEEFNGVVGAIVDPQYFSKFYDLLSQTNGIQTIFYHQNGVVVSSSNDLTGEGWPAIGQSISDHPFFFRDTSVMFKQKTPYLSAGKRINKGNEYLGIFDHLSGTTNTVSLQIAALISKKTALTQFRQNLVSALAFSLTVIILTAGLMFVSFRQINARRKTNDDLLKSVARTKAAEKHVARINGKLQKLNNELEQRIEDRTSELKAALNHSQSLQQQVIEQEKIASLGQLVAGIAHEINSPLGAALTALTTLNDFVDQYEHNRANENSDDLISDGFIEKIKYGNSLMLNNLERAANLTQSFMQVAVDRQISNVRELDICRYLNDIVSSLIPQARKAGVRIKVTCNPGISCLIDPGALAQVLTNLVINALVHAFEHIDEKRVTINVSTDSGMILLTVLDNGCGMADEVREKIFDPFFTTKRGGGGTGLGMHIVYNIVQAKLNGTVRVISSPESGTLVEVRFPESVTAETH
ncbi:MAG: hypothetical protein JEZ12_27065 [Desulfobacterium sp.]|nr:hypothetical protein [Desulfobacterium sp.]